MTARLTKLEIKNFKSFADDACVNNFTSLNMIIGTNGSGKSNFLEAIAFAFGENKFRSRPTNINNFINSAPNGEEKECYVACIFKYDMEDIKFKRTLRKNQSIWAVNNNIVNKEEYKKKLNEIGINTKTRYFIIYQGESMESLLEKPKERAVRFEEITGSVDYKEEYEYLQKKLEQQLDERKMLNGQITNLKKKKRYQKLTETKIAARSELQSEYEKMTQKLNLLQLYMIEENMKSYRKEYELLEKKKVDSKTEQEKLKEELNYKNEILAKNKQIIIDLTKQTEAKKKELENIKKKLGDSSNKINKIKQSIHKVEQNICEAEQAEKLRIEKMKQLEEEYQQTEKLYHQTNEQLQKLNEKNIPEMEEEYNLIKERLYFTKSEYFTKLEEIRFSRNLLHKNISNRKTLIIKKQDEIKKINSFLENYDKYSDQSKKLNDEFEKLKKEQKEREKLIESYRKKEKEIEQELMDIEKQLQISKFHRNYIEKNEKKNTILKSLQESIKEGVYGYLSDLCQPTHSRYETALDVFLRKYSSTIVVDTEETTYLCHKIAQNFLERIKFLTLGLMRTPKIREPLQDINAYEGIKNVKLTIDILKYPEKIKQAVLHIFKNTLVCETSEDAFQVAYNLKSKQRYDCISLNGIYYKKNGIIFKSKPTMKKNISDISSLKDTRNKLLVEMNDIKEKLITLNPNQMEKLSKIQSECIDKKISLIKNLMATHEKQKEQKEQLESELFSLMKEEDKDQQELKNLDKNENEFKVDKECEESYKEFYKKYNITDISKFQDLIKKLTKLRSDQEKYINHMEKIKTMLELEKINNTKCNLKHCQMKMDDLRKQLQEENDEIIILEKEKNEKILPLELLQEKLKKINDDDTQLKKEVNGLEKRLSELRHEFFYSDYNNYRRCAHLYKQSYKEFSHLLYQARGTNLPLIEGSYESIQSSFDSDENKDVMMRDIASENIPTFNIGPKHSIQLDYSLIANEITNNNIDSLKNICEDLKSQLKIIDQKISELYISKQWSQELEEVIETLKELNHKIYELNKDLEKNKRNLYEIKRKRSEKFMAGFEIISEWVKKIYKLLCANEDANAFLEVLNLEEPYLSNIEYICFPRKQTFYGHCNLSGGEKIIAMLSLILAILKVNSSFLLLFDEVDAPLDKIRSRNIVEYFKTLNESHQVMYSTFNRDSMLYADKLIGIQAVTRNGIKSSRIFTLNLDGY